MFNYYVWDQTDPTKVAWKLQMKKFSSLESILYSTNCSIKHELVLKSSGYFGVHSMTVHRHLNPQKGRNKYSLFAVSNPPNACLPYLVVEVWTVKGILKLSWSQVELRNKYLGTKWISFFKQIPLSVIYCRWIAVTSSLRTYTFVRTAKRCLYQNSKSCSSIQCTKVRLLRKCTLTLDHVSLCSPQQKYWS